MITQLNELPEGILDLNAEQLYTKIDNHTLVHLPGKIQRPVFISILQHGDEHTGWDALKDYLNNHSHILPRSLSILFGNIQAAKCNIRQIDGEADFNRRWPSHLNLDGPVATTMREITEIMEKRQPFASVDMHNNSGRNPHYSGINSLDTEFVNLASLFSDTMIYFTSPTGIQSGAFAKFCPSVTVECGLSGASNGKEQTHIFLELLLNQSNLLKVPSILEHKKVYEVQASIRIKKDINFGYKEGHDFALVKDLDCLNFHQLNIGEKFGQINGVLADKQIMPFSIIDENNCEIINDYFTIQNNNIICSKRFVPAMITQNIKAIKNDCLCYIMQSINLEKGK